MPLPPTNNSLNQEQRTRLLRSNRKLEALLGATPHLLDSELASPSLKSKLSKRHATIRPLYAQNSSDSSLDSTESEYVLIRHPHLTSSAAHHPIVLPSRSSPSSSRSASPISTHRLKVSVTRESMSLPVAVETVATNKKNKGPQALSQPLLLRLRAIPVKQSPHTGTSPVAPVVKPFLTPAERRRFKVDSVIGPLSPINQSHSRSYTIADLRSPISPTTSSGEPGQGLTDREKRWKMAKLQRTLGENVPLELVFGQQRAKTDKKTKRRSRSVAYARPGVMDLFAEDTKPTPVVGQASTVDPSKTASSSSCKNRKHRPRSLTLGSASALVAADIKLAEQQNQKNHQQQLHHGRGRMGGLGRAKSAAAVKKREREGDIKAKDTRGTVSMDEGMRSLPSSHQSSDVSEEWRRKERGWSGEWNVRDMQEVAKALRGLKAR